MWVIGSNRICYSAVSYTHLDVYKRQNKDFKHVFADYCKYLIQVHKSYYINPCYLKSLKNDSVILEKNILVPLGMKYKKNIRTYFIKQFAHF